MSGKGTPASVAAQRAGIEFSVHDVGTGAGGPGDGGYGVAVAAALGVDPARVLKTLVADVDGELAVGVVPVAQSLDLKALAVALGRKRAAMADPTRAERATGYVRGGISPLGQRRRLPTVVDASVGSHPTVYVSAGRRGLELELAPADLVRLLDATTADIAR
ncbi:MAG TPA: Cys-tRNA(Pro) deacylase [Acidimicrobiales bacterium]|nr:Cys-tRNA(Pro) deacylase [Acidimicrobiales bacterium]